MIRLEDDENGCEGPELMGIDSELWIIDRCDERKGKERVVFGGMEGCVSYWARYCSICGRVRVDECWAWIAIRKVESGGGGGYAVMESTTTSANTYT